MKPYIFNCTFTQPHSSLVIECMDMDEIKIWSDLATEDKTINRAIARPKYCSGIIWIKGQKYNFV